MLILALAIVVAPLAWLVIKRLQDGDPAAARRAQWWVVGFLGAAVALRVALAAPVVLRVALVLLAMGAFAFWLRRHGGGGGGDDGRDPPIDPGPDPVPGRRATPPREHLDAEAFDRARDDWERALNRHAAD